MNKSMNISGMTYNDLKAGYEALMVSINEQMEKCREYEQAIINKKEEVMREFARAYMAVKEIGVTEEEMEAFLDKESATAEVCGQEPPTLPEPIQEENVTLVEEEDSTNPENNEEEENKVETASIWDNPPSLRPITPWPPRRVKRLLLLKRPLWRTLMRNCPLLKTSSPMILNTRLSIIPPLP